MLKQNQRTRLGNTDRQDTSEPADTGSLVGAWRLTIAPLQGTPVPALVTLHADGTLSSASLPVEPFLGAADRVIFVSPGHGVWEPAGVKLVSLKIVGLAATERGAQAAGATILGRGELSADGRSISGFYAATVYDPAGVQLATEEGTLQATRITLED
jgi:hypothetical protein